MTLVIVRLGVGNTASVRHALERLGATPVLTDDPEVIARADRVILPGVGAAAPAMATLRARGLVPVLTAFSRPLLGICLGHQLLFEESAEGGCVQGLGRLPGRVERLPVTPQEPVPHMGWTRLTFTRPDPLTRGIADGSYAYFVHSYARAVDETTLASARHATPFAAIARGAAPMHAQVYGCQFHPERSGPIGARLLDNFMRVPC